MQSKEFFEALRILEEEKGIKKEYFIEALEAGLTAAYKKLYGEAKSAIVKLNPEKNTIKIYSYKTVVDEVTDPDKQVSLQDAKLIKKSYKVGDEIMQEENSKNFGRIPSQTVRHVIMQKIKEAVRAKEFAELSEKEGQIITAQIIRFENGYYYLNMGGMEAEGVIAEKDCIPNERIEIQSRVKVYVRRIVESPKGCQIQCTRTNTGFVAKLLELEIPELQDHEIEIKAISRDAGYRTKVAIAPVIPNFDAVGACIGNRGMRINNIISELNGEKVDIVPYSENPTEFISNALSPAEVLKLDIDESNKACIAVVPNDKLSLAIGKDGQNVRLAVKLTGWKIDVKSEQQYSSVNTTIQTNTEDVAMSDEELFGEIDDE